MLTARLLPLDSSPQLQVLGFCFVFEQRAWICWFFGCLFYFLFGYVAPDQLEFVGLKDDGSSAGDTERETFGGRFQHLKWIGWYKLFHYYTEQLGIKLHFMNWGWQPLAGQTTEVVDPRCHKIMAVDPNVRTIDETSFQLYLHLLKDVKLTGKKLLEVSSGKGGGLACIAASTGVDMCVGVDLCTGNVTYCTETYETAVGGRGFASTYALDAAETGALSFRQGDAMKLADTFGADTGMVFDFVLNVEASHCYPSRPDFFSSVWDVLAPGGTLLFVDFMSGENLVKCQKALGDKTKVSFLNKYFLLLPQVVATLYCGANPAHTLCHHL